MAAKEPKPPRVKKEKPKRKTRLEKSYDRIVRLGGIIMRVHGEMGAIHYQTPGGTDVLPTTFQNLKRAGLLRAAGDGLFEGADQTFHVIPNKF